MQLFIMCCCLFIGWAHALFRHWELIQELKKYGLSLIGGFGLLRDIKVAKTFVSQGNRDGQLKMLNKAARWADASPLIMFAILIFGFSIVII